MVITVNELQVLGVLILFAVMTFLLCTANSVKEDGTKWSWMWHVEGVTFWVVLVITFMLMLLFNNNALVPEV